MMQATEHITSEDEGEAAAAAAAAAETSRWKRFEPEIKTLHRLAEHTSKTKEPGNLTGTNRKKFSFVTAKFVHFFETVHTKKHISLTWMNHCHNRNTQETTNGHLLPLAFCMLASLWLNLPFMPSDFARWAMNGTLPTFHCYQMLPRKSAYKRFFKPSVCIFSTNIHESIPLTFCAQGIVKRFDLAVLTEGLAREMSLPFPQLNGPYCVEHIITFYRLPRLFLPLFSTFVLLSSTTTHITGALTKRAQLLLSQVPADIVRTEILLVSVVVLAVKMTFDFDGEYIKAWLRAWSVYWPSDTPWVDAFVFSFHQSPFFNHHSTTTQRTTKMHGDRTVTVCVVLQQDAVCRASRAADKRHWRDCVDDGHAPHKH